VAHYTLEKYMADSPPPNKPGNTPPNKPGDTQLIPIEILDQVAKVSLDQTEQFTLGSTSSTCCEESVN
jgi:hypothetical protein